MVEVIIYSKAGCPYCDAAKLLLKHKGVSFTEFRVDLDPAMLQEMKDRTGGRTMPQIIINGEAIGGFDDMRALDVAGQLDDKLKLGE